VNACEVDTPWSIISKADPRGAALADRHYSRRTRGSRQFSPPGRVLPLLFETPWGGALWVTREERRDLTSHAWPGAWQITIFRNESPLLASDLVRHAVSLTIQEWGPLPREGMITFVAPSKVRSTNPGCCFKKAGLAPRRAHAWRPRSRAAPRLRLWNGVDACRRVGSLSCVAIGNSRHHTRRRLTMSERMRMPKGAKLVIICKKCEGSFETLDKHRGHHCARRRLGRGLKELAAAASAEAPPLPLPDRVRMAFPGATAS
jgi:hypothetical protein